MLRQGAGRPSVGIARGALPSELTSARTPLSRNSGDATIKQGATITAPASSSVSVIGPESSGVAATIKHGCATTAPSLAPALGPATGVAMAPPPALPALALPEAVAET
jgi:hypothetical protein